MARNAPLFDENDLFHDFEDDAGAVSDASLEPARLGNGTNEATDPTTADTDILGLDSEVQIKHRRKKVVLDDEKLLQPKGLPRIRKTVATAALKNNPLRLRGKGHELNDLRKLLDFYQLWAHGIFPKARLEDFAVLADSVGKKSRRLREYRLVWIDEAIEATRRDAFGNSNHDRHHLFHSDGDNAETESGGNGEVPAQSGTEGSETGRSEAPVAARVVPRVALSDSEDSDADMNDNSLFLGRKPAVEPRNDVLLDDSDDDNWLEAAFAKRPEEADSDVEEEFVVEKDGQTKEILASEPRNSEPHGNSTISTAASASASASTSASAPTSPPLPSIYASEQQPPDEMDDENEEELAVLQEMGL